MARKLSDALENGGAEIAVAGTSRRAGRQVSASADSIGRWRSDYVLWVEAFARGNPAFLALDIYFAHSGNGFLRRAEYFPLFLSLGAPALLAVALARANSGTARKHGPGSDTWWG